MTHRIELTLLWGLLVIAFVLRIGALTYGLPQSFFGDELVHVAASFTMIGEKAFRPNFSFYYLPPLFSYLLTPFFLIYGAGAIAVGFFSSVGAFKEFVLLHREYFLIFSRIVSALFGTATIWLFYHWGKAMFGRGAALLAAGFLMFDLLHLHESQIGRIWAPTAFFFVWGMYALWQWSESGRKIWMFQAALAIGLGYGMGYLPILLSVLFLAVQIVLWRRGKTVLLNKNFIWGVLTIFVCIGIFSFANTYGFQRQFGSVVATVGSGLHITIAETPVGTSSENNFFANCIAVFIVFWRDNPFILVLGMLGAVFLFVRDRFSLRFIFLVLFPIFYILFFSSTSANMDSRYLLPVLPELFLLGGFFVLMLSEVKIFSFLPVILSILLGGVALFYGVYGVLGYEVLLQKLDTRIQAIHWINQNVSEHARIVLDDYTIYLSMDKQGIAVVDRYHPERLDTRMRFLKNLDDANYPYPSYAVFDVSRAGNDQKALMDFLPDYLVYSFWTQDERQTKENEYAFLSHKRLVAFFSPRKDGKEAGEDILADPKMIYAFLSSLQSLGPSVAIYSTH